jgi:hypothetical protein
MSLKIKSISSVFLTAFSLFSVGSAQAAQVVKKNVDICVKTWPPADKPKFIKQCEDLSKTLNGSGNGEDFKFESAFCVNDNDGFKASKFCGIYDVVLKVTMKIKIEEEKF